MSKTNSLRKQNDDINAKFSEQISQDEAMALRQAAWEWAEHGRNLTDEPSRAYVRKGDKLDSALLAAARAYAAAYEGR